MALKHDAGRGNPMPRWPLYILAALALAMAVFALIRFLPDRDLPVKGDAPDTDAPGLEQNNTPDQENVSGDEPQAGPNADVLAEADLLARGYYYDEALALLEGKEGDDIAAKRTEFEGLKAALVPYTGRYYHIFFHSLIIDTDLAFDNIGHSAKGYNEWMTTVSEFQKMLPLLLENDFVLYDITELVELDANGKAQPKQILLPEGKKPLVISIDDVNYYDYMKTDGFADRLDVDENGRVVTIVKDADGTEHATYDGDVMPILDSFVLEHPEFSFRGAKGIVAETGYAGAFGYRITDLDWFTPDEQKAMLAKVEEIAQALRNWGWQISSHSYTHNQYWNKLTITMDEMAYDTGRWKNEIEPYVGETNIFISPFGVHFGADEERFRYLIEEGGFNIYCPVGSNMNAWFEDDVFYMERLNLDGYTMIKHPERVSNHFFDPALVLDPARPPMD
ncbi:MAG: hypothetical protein IJC44_08250 [Clostridia bacterium]|nr:hypothetical protein [Clostridia bacterium]